MLHDHLEEWLGAWPELGTGLLVVPSPKRTEPGWDGEVHNFIGVTSPEFGVVSVPESAVEAVRTIVHGHDLRSGIQQLQTHTDQLSEALGHEATVGIGVFRWSYSPTELPSVGQWTPTADPRVPPWLRKFNGDVLVEWDTNGNYGAGVGRKQHNQFGHEISVGTEAALQGLGIARRLVSTAAQTIVRSGAVATYIHDIDNHASAKVADAAGFPDCGWRMLGLWG